jgi:transposase
MRKVILTMKEEKYYQTIKQVSEGKIKKKRAAIKLDLSLRHIDRLLKNYQNVGKATFSHGNKNRRPKHALSSELKQKIANLYQEKYQNANFTHFTELLASEEKITISRTTINTILKEKGILSPKAQRKTKREYNKKLRQKLKSVKRKAEKVDLEEKIIDLVDAHPRKARKKYFGEMLQMDASIHRWFGEEKSALHIAIDDCTGRILGAYFDPEETLNGYYNVLYQILRKYGIPYEFLTDRRTVFEYELKRKKCLEKDTFTQFSYACHRLGLV